MASEAKSLGFGELEHLDGLNGDEQMRPLLLDHRPHRDEERDSKLLSRVGLTCMTHFICSTIKTWARNPRLRDQADPGDPDKVRAVTRDVLATLDPKFFEADWASTSYDTHAGRDLVMADLETLSFNVANGEQWYEGLRVISREWLQETLAAGAGAVPPREADEAQG